jgi:hypothetical protein
MPQDLAHTAAPGETCAPEPSASPANPPGYELIDEIGLGMGVVYRARVVALERDVAVKLLSERHPADSLPAQRFLIRHDLDDADEVAEPEVRKDLLALDEALTKLSSVDPQAAQLVQIRYFAGLSIPDTAKALGVSLRTAERLWSFARVWLLRVVGGDVPDDQGS